MKRILTACFLTVIFAVVVLNASSAAFKWLVAAVIVGCLNEFHRLILPWDRLYRWIGVAFGAWVAVLHIWQPVSPFTILDGMIVGLFLIMLVMMITSTAVEGTLARVGFIVLGAVYLSLTLPFFVKLRELDHGRSLVGLTIVMAALGDTAAMVVGKWIGRHKLARLLSPHKTVEGVVAGFGGTVAASLLWRQFVWPEFPLVHAVAAALLIGVVGPIGDLAESLVKRNFHVKDSGGLLPGHGGILDRADALIFSAPCIYYYVTWMKLA